MVTTLTATAGPAGSASAGAALIAAAVISAEASAILMALFMVVSLFSSAANARRDLPISPILQLM